MKILISGGHLTPALAFIDLVKAEHPQDKIVFVGREFSQNRLRQKAVERSEVEARGIKFISLASVSADLNRLADLFIKPAKFLYSLIQANQILNQEDPDVFLSFGGYLAVPLALIAYLKKVPIVTHEQTKVAGRATQFLSKLADKIAVTFENTKYLPELNNLVVTGNPLRPAIFNEKVQQPAWFHSTDDCPLLLIMGGNQGSKKINDVVQALLPELIKDWQIVHLCGRPNLENNYKKKLTRAAAILKPEEKNRYFVKEWISGSDLSWLYRYAYGAISRAGVNSLLELTALDVPTIFIPLPQANFNEQLENAQWLADSDAALILEEKELNLENMKFFIKQLRQRHQHLKHYLSEIKVDKNADKALYRVLKEVYESQ